MKSIRMLILLSISLAMWLNLFGQDRKVNSHGLDIHYQIIGQGTPLLIIGGGPGDVAGRYLSLCELLSKNVQCILVEQRGTGQSAPAVCDASTISVALTIDDFEAIRRQLGLKQWAVLGFSYGGYLASVYAHDFPDSISALVLLGSMGLNWEGLRTFDDNITSKLQASDLEVVEYWSDKGRLKADFQHAVTEIIRAKMPGYFFDRKKALLVSQTMKDSDFDFSMGDFIYQDVAARKLDLAKMKNTFENPVLIVHGRQDPGGDAVAMVLERYYPKSKLVFVEKAGHYSWIEQPEKVLAAIVEFLSPGKLVASTGMELLLIPAGSFIMGSPAGEGKADEHPAHRVSISKPFYMGKYPVTVAEFRQFVTDSGYQTEAEKGRGAWVWTGKNDWEQTAGASWKNPYFPQLEHHPVVCVTWNDAKAYCAWLSQKEGLTCRLPTEAEFEYACRAGTTTAWFFGPEANEHAAYGWPQALTPQGFPTHPAGLKQPNPLGLHDLLGNAWQWCEDWYDPNYYSVSPKTDPRGAAAGESRVNRGGMGADPQSWRSAARDALPPESNYSNQTFRVVMALIPDPAPNPEIKNQ